MERIRLRRREPAPTAQPDPRALLERLERLQQRVAAMAAAAEEAEAATRRQRASGRRR